MISDTVTPTEPASAAQREDGIGATIAASAAVVACTLTHLPDHLLSLTGVQGWVPGLVVVMALVNGARGVARAPFTYARREMSKARWAAQTVSTLVAAVGIGVVLTIPLYALLRASSWWWLWAWALFAAVTVAGQFLMPLIMGRRLGPLEPAPAELALLVQTIESQVSVASAESRGSTRRGNSAGAGVYVATDSPRPASRRSSQCNAYVLGLGRTRRVVLEPGMAAWPPTLIAQAVAHELGHWRLHHTARRLPLAVAVQLATFALAAAVLSFHPLLSWAGIASAGDPRSYPLLLALTAAFVFPARLILAAYDRGQERAADRFALHVLGDPDAYAAMLDLLGRNGDAFRELPWWRQLTATHPAIDQRIQDCQMQKEPLHV
ncbi:MAG: M48 family metalloprotease [Acidimicrobiales bacterium]